jgi:hypothetical protein
MYGFLKIPISTTSSEKKEYRKYMCTLCDSLHENYGIKGRIFTNYDSTTLALLIGALDDSVNKEITEPPKLLCLRPLMHKKAPDIFKFVSAVSMMIAYSKLLDDAIENNKKIPRWIEKSSDLASEYLSKYGLDKSFFKNKLQEQHRLEKECTNIEILSDSSSEITSRIFSAVGELTNETKYSSCLKKLGFELGKLIYFYDGILDYQNDSKAGIFNCISACYLTQNKDIQRASGEIYNFIGTAKNNISSILKKIEHKNNATLIRKILLQDFEIRVIKHEKGVLSKLKGTRLSCATCSSNRLTKQTVYGILTGTLTIQTAAASNFQEDDSCGALCAIPCCCYLCCFCNAQWLRMIHEQERHQRALLF